MKNKIVLVELLKIVTKNFTVYQRELVIQTMKRKCKFKITTVKIGKQKRRIIKTRQVVNTKILKCIINELKQSNLEQCRVSKGLINDIYKQFEKLFDTINMPVNKKEIKVAVHKIINSSRQRAQLLKEIELILQGGKQ